MKRVALAIATFGYVGFFPIAPGTAGSLAALPLYALVQWVGYPLFEWATIVMVCAAGIWAATAAESLLGGKDPGPVVIDEVLGMLITLAFIPVSLTGVVVGFVLFRIFDIVKPYPAGRMESLSGGWGVMLDDAMAGVYGNLALRALAYLIPAWVIS